MLREPEPMRQIHEIRLKIYEKEKNLSMEERISKRHREAEEIIKKYGLKFIKKKTKAA
ncbi:MAG: hypothetical protein LHV68_13250 [Elusimicrobia bacterium]|nr:hypothetical protein [Candidatus Liberimonas magnetica]